MRDGWTETTLGEVARINPETTPKWPDAHQIRYVDIASVSWGQPIAPAMERQAYGSAPGRARRRIRQGDVVVSTVRPNLRAMALVPPELDGEVASTGFAVLRAREDIALPGFVWAVVSHEGFRDDMVRKATGSNYPAVRSADVASHLVSLPPVDEQRRIVDVIGAVDDAVEASRRAHGKAESLLTALVNHNLAAVDGTTRRLGDFVTVVRGGSPRPIDKFYTDSPDGLNWVRIGDVDPGGKYITATEKKIDPSGLGRTRSVSVGDFVLSNSMSFGRPYIMRTDGCIHDGWLKLSGFSANMSEDYLYYLLRSDYVQGRFEQLAAGSSVRNLNKDKVASIEVVVPTRGEQDRITDQLDGLGAAIDAAAVHARTLRALRSSLLGLLLSGEHVIPASYDALLEATE